MTVDNNEIRGLLDQLQAHIQGVLGEKLVGLYVVGSLVIGDFDPAVSDIDLIAALASPLDENESGALNRMHAEIARMYPAWDDRIEVVYIAAAHLQTPALLDQLGVISPGEPFHVFAVNAGDWLINWYLLRGYGRALVGAAPQTFVASIALDELLPQIYRQLAELPESLTEPIHWGAQAYTISTMCRSLYTFKQRVFPSKKQALLWAKTELPQWSPLIERVLVWRAAGQPATVDAEAALPETREFVRFVLEKISAIAPPIL